MLSQQFQISIPTERQNKGQNVVQISTIPAFPGQNIFEKLK